MKVRIRYMTNTGHKWTRRILRENDEGLYVLINSNRCYVQPLRYKDTGEIIHYLSTRFELGR